MGLRFTCVECGNVTRARFDVCSRCRAWGTCQRAKITREELPRLSDVRSDDRERILIRPDWDQALCGGFRLGMAVLVAGKPGGGKTSDMLSLAALAGSKKSPSLYLTSERDVEDLAAAARKMSLDLSHIAAMRVRTMREARKAIERTAPAVVVLDSATNLDRFEADDMIDLKDAIGDGIAFVICHVTKSQEIAGRNGLAHHASAIVWIRGKTLRTTKNWYGPAPLSVRRRVPVFR